MEIRTEDITKKRIFIFLGIVFGILYIPWIVGILVPNFGSTVYAIISSPVVFMGTPALAVLITRKLTKDTISLNFSTKIFKNKKALLFSALIPSASIFLGTVLFFLIFPEDLDFQGRYISATYGTFGAPQNIELTIGSMLLMGLIVYVISAVAFPIWYIALGEDIGWQGYLLPLLCKKVSVKCAVIINGALWGLAHAPLIYYGMNYGKDYYGAPYTGILMMILVNIVLGIWMSYITLKTKNCMYAAIIHGSADIIGEVGTWISLSTKSSLLGPTPTGIIGLSFLIIGGVILFFKMPCDVE
ncbi:MAG: CPBP family intramembrane metalloprotease [Lachnospiraceae bacterium]|nr:CPBP family intramembrane metalloprotease [Lachnospiraceae bacterium]